MRVLACRAAPCCKSYQITSARYLACDRSRVITCESIKVNPRLVTSSAYLYTCKCCAAFRGRPKRFFKNVVSPPFLLPGLDYIQSLYFGGIIFHHLIRSTSAAPTFLLRVWLANVLHHRFQVFRQHGCCPATSKSAA